MRDQAFKRQGWVSRIRLKLAKCFPRPFLHVYWQDREQPSERSRRV
jgi:hypothetical protein